MVGGYVEVLPSLNQRQDRDSTFLVADNNDAEFGDLSVQAASFDFGTVEVVIRPSKVGEYDYREMVCCCRSATRWLEKVYVLDGAMQDRTREVITEKIAGFFEVDPPLPA